jgi:hypothetical protein
MRDASEITSRYGMAGLTISTSAPSSESRCYEGDQ